YRDTVLARIPALKLDRHVSYLGPQQRVAPILRGCDIGVLSSLSEGLPLSLLEYGAAGLASVATEVGQCGEVLDGGKTGILVPAGSPSRLSEALLRLNVAVDPSKENVTNFTLRVGAMAESVTVNAAQATVEPKTVPMAKARPAPAPLFEIVTDKGVRWTSADGVAWQPK
ncbi:MAG: glycosyltransferase family 4 protein, partial [Terracidiphilus sp.]